MAGRPLRVLVTPPSGHQQIAARASADLGFDVALSVLPTDDLRAQVLSEPDSFDVVQAEFWMIDALCQHRTIQPFSRAALPNFELMSPLFTEGLVGKKEVSRLGVAPLLERFADSKLWLNAVPTICNSDTLGWRPDRVQIPITSWSDLLRADLAGRVGLADVPAVTHLEVSLACQALKAVRYDDIGQQTVEEIDATYDFLAPFANSGHFDSIWASFERSVERMTEGPVALQSLWPPAVTALKQRRVPVRYNPLTEGSRGWAGGLCLSSHVDEDQKRRAISYMNWYIGGWAGAYLTRQGYYSSTPDAARRYLTQSEWNYWQKGLPAIDPVIAPNGAVIGQPGEIREGGSYEDRMSRIVCWNVQMETDAHLRFRWKAFREQIVSRTRAIIN